MIKKIIPLIAAALMYFSVAQAQISVYHVNSDLRTTAKKGVFYTLPRTTLKVEVIIKATDHLKGSLSELAGKYVGIVDPVKFDNTTYSIEDVNVVPLSEPDPSQVYYVETGIGKSSKSSGLVNLNFNEDGFLCSTFDINKHQSSIETGSQIIFTEERKSDASELYTFQAFGNIKAKIDTIIRKVTVDTAIIQKYVFRARSAEKSDEELASEILGKIQALRDSKYKLLTGFQEIAYQPETFKFMIDQLDKQENEYLAIFAGKSISGYLRYTFFYTPSYEPEKEDITLFRFSPTTGINPPLSNSGEIVALKITSNGISKVAKDFQLRQIEDGKPTGFFYRMTEKANVIVAINNKELFHKPIIINQFGQVFSLSPDKLKVEFYPETGGLKSVLGN